MVPSKCRPSKTGPCSQPEVSVHLEKRSPGTDQPDSWAWRCSIQYHPLNPKLHLLIIIGYSICRRNSIYIYTCIYNPSGGRNAVILLFHKSVLCGLGKDCGSQPSLTVSRRTTSSRSWARSPGKRTDPPSPFEIATGSPKSKPPIRSKSSRAQERSPWNRIASSHSGAIMRILFNKGFVIVFSTATIRITLNMILW